MTPRDLRHYVAQTTLPLSIGGWRKFIAFLGPGYLVAVGYMDPGNWATAIAGGSHFGYALLSIALISNLMAILLQALCVRLGLASGRDLAQSCRDAYPRKAAIGLWLLAELAICATDLAEIIGTAIGLYLLFGLPLLYGISLTALDVFLVILLQRLGFRWIEAFVIALLAIIFGCFFFQMWFAAPNLLDVLNGFIPQPDILTNPEMLYLSMGIIGATVMPHNLYLHSSIVQSRPAGNTLAEKKQSIRFATIDSTLALMLALVINASILILAAATFYTSGNVEITELQEAHAMIAPLLGSSLAASLFAVALLCCGLNSTVTATLSGQIVMEGFVDIKIPAWVRRLITRGIAIIPALLVTALYGERATGQLLIGSQVILSLQLPFAIVPLVLFTMDRKKMGELVAPRWMSILAGLVALILILLNIKMLWDIASGLNIGGI